MQSKPSSPSVHAWYALRRTLPTWCFERNLAELKKMLPRYGVDEVIIKVDTEEFTHGQPPLDWVRRYQPRLFEIKRAMQRLGIRYSLNPWITVGHCDRGRDGRRQLPGLQTVVGHDGTECACCACPMSPVWRQHVARVWKLYAETEPTVLWVEDDIRSFGHRPVQYGCFCPDHLHAFSQRAGQAVTREALVAALLQAGQPHPWRGLFLDMQAELMTETVAFLARTVHSVSPRTSMGLMSSGPRIHCIEGRRWIDLGQAMADGQPLYSRPPMGNYNEDSLRGFYYSHDSIKITRHCLPPDTIEQTEVENVPFTRYSKSVVFTFLEMAISFAYGSHGVTMNLFDHAGTPMEDEPAYGCMLAAKKPWLEALAQRAQAAGSYRGVRLLHSEKAAYVRRLQPGATIYRLAADGEAAMQTLESHGIPTTYAASNVTAVTGQTLNAYDDAAIQELLGGGLLLDGVAAAGLVERGFGADLGLKSAAAPVHLDTLGALSAEEFNYRPFGGRDRNYLTLTVPDLGGRPHVSVMRPARGAVVASWIVDPDARRRFPGMLVFENTRGGRVVVHSLDWATAAGVAFNHPFRLRQLQGAVRWLARGRIPLQVNGGVYPLAFRKDTGATTLLGLFNLTLDAWPFVEFRLYDRRTVGGVDRLDDNGCWRPAPEIAIMRRAGCHALRSESAVGFDRPLILTIHWA